MGSAHSFWVAVIMLVVCGSHEGIARTQHDGHEQTDLPCTLRVIPVHLRQFFLARAGINLKQKVLVVRTHRTQPD